jgi:hypothetical protein
MVDHVVADQIVDNGYIPVILRPGEKRPLHEGWEKTTPETARQAWSNAPTDANLGILCGSLITIIDFDAHPDPENPDKPNGRQVYDQLAKTRPEIFEGTIIEQTPSRGIHVTYRGNGGEKTYARFSMDGESVDIEVLRGRRQAVAPPSRVPAGDYVYLSEKTHLNTRLADLSEVPQLFRDAIALYETEQARRHERRLVENKPSEEFSEEDKAVIEDEMIRSLLKGATVNHRHDHAQSLACNLAGVGCFSESEIDRAVEKFFSRCNREAPRNEVNNIVRWAYDHPDLDPPINWTAVQADRRRRGQKTTTPSRELSDAEIVQQLEQREKEQRRDQVEAEKRRLNGPVEEPDKWQLYTLKNALEPREPIEYAAEGLVSFPSVVITYGPPGNFKTFLMMDLAMSIAEGADWLPPERDSQGRPIDDVQAFPVNKYRVLWVDLDQGKRRTMDRLAMLARGHNCDTIGTTLYFYTMPFPPLDASSEKDMEALEHRIRTLGVRVVFVDCLATVSGSIDENNAEMKNVIYGFRQLAERTGTAFVIIHHARKSGASTYGSRDGDSLRGHSSIEGGIDLALLVKKEGHDKRMVTISSTKTRDVDVPKFNAHFTYWKDHHDNPCAMFYRVSPESVIEASEASVKLAVTDVLNRNGPTARGKLMELVKARIPGHEKNGDKFVGGVIDQMVVNNKIKMTKGKGNSKVYEVE